MGLLYYIPARRFPGGKTPDVVKGDALAEFGLAHLAGAALTHRGVRNQGPDGGAGLIIGLGVPSGETGYFKDEQEWHPVQGGDLYVGWKDAPAPNALLRQRAPKATVNVVLGDGQAWGFVETSALPKRRVFDAAGERDWAPLVCYEAHYEAQAWIYDFLKQHDERAYDDILDRVAICLGSRYHISALEVVALGLFTTDLLDAICFACLGVEEKKTEAEPEV